jgi:hypothetical protein
MKTAEEIEKKGEFITLGEAKEYCRLNGLDCLKPTMPIFQIAGAIRDARKDERKKIAEEVKDLQIGDIVTAKTVYNAILKG